MTMNVRTLADKLKIECIHEGKGEREATGCYAGDLLSRVMGRACAGDAWITIMSNVNVAAVASLADVACVILAEGVTPDAELQKKLGIMDMPVFATDMSTYETAWKIHAILEGTSSF
jgi:BioD-like phosphotransacetylase family protein